MNNFDNDNYILRFMYVLFYISHKPSSRFISAISIGLNE